MTTATEHPAGVKGSTRRLLSSFASSVASHDVWAIRLVFIAGLATIFHKAGLPVPYYAAVFAVCLGVAALLYEMNAATFALRSFWNGRAFSAFGWAFVWAIAFAYSVNQWIGAASENEGAKTNVHQTAYTASINVQDRVAKTKKEVDRLEGRMSWMDTAVNGKPVRSVEAAQADLDNARANRFWNLTNECKETKGPQTRAFCADVAAWKSEKSLASERITLKTELDAAKADYNEAQLASKNTKVEASFDRKDNLLLTRYGGLKQEDAQALTAVGSIIAISFFISVATMLKELEHLRTQGPRTKIFNIRGLIARARYHWDGTTGTNTTTIITDKEAEDRIREAARASLGKYAAAH